MPDNGEVYVNGQKAKSYYKMTWFSLMDALDEAVRFEESDYYLRMDNGKIHKIHTKYDKGQYRMTVNNTNLKIVSNMGEAYTVLAQAVGYKKDPPA